MRIVDRIPTSFSGIKLPSGNYCLAKSKELAAKEFIFEDSEIDPEAITRSIINHSGAGLIPKDRRALPYLVLDSRFRDFNPEFCETVLKEYSSARGFWTRLFRAWLYHYDLESKTGQIVRRALAKNKSLLNDASLGIDAAFNVLDNRPNRSKVAAKILDNTISSQSLHDVNFSSDGISGGRFSIALMSDIAKYCMDRPLGEDQLARLIDLICPQGIIHESIRAVALVSFIYGMREKSKESQCYLKAKEIIDNSFQDPRIGESTWPTISEYLGGQTTRQVCIDTVKQWHIFQSIRLFFKIIEEVVEDGNDHQFPQRRDFWIDYFNRGLVSDAWVVLAKKGAEEAIRYQKQGDHDFAKLIWASLTGAKPDQCVLLMKIGNITVVEWSHSGACRVWKKGDSNAPNFSSRSYTGSDLRAQVLDEERDRIRHDPAGNWRASITKRINDYSGLRRFL